MATSAAAGLPGCSDDDIPPKRYDFGVPDTATLPEAGLDAAPDARVDTTSDQGADANADAATEAGADGARDMAQDAAPAD